MNNDVTEAVLRLQGGLMSGRLQPWRAEQTEEALNALLAKPQRTGVPFHLARNALSDARKKLQRRSDLLADRAAEIDVMAETGSTGGAPGAGGYEVLRREVIDTVNRRSTPADREILAVALEGGTAGDVAAALGVDYDIAKVRLSRARSRARAAWV
ncbi:MAG: hypothetical protein E7773_14975 [Sphingomonas sp.]|uniref:hypothetical protein n=1 Tax=Sphingomonas sp. TaxID=28214 RepID=UPI001222D765|nr:hypothetical protein [Sphingomonas sp.]THD34490.1 MAG: hypothetical protein E7773_14975 [Sphingomonas sp.]